MTATENFGGKQTAFVMDTNTLAGRVHCCSPEVDTVSIVGTKMFDVS